MNFYYAVIFSSRLKTPATGYVLMANKMASLAQQQPGYLGIESARDDKLGITVSYWKDEKSITAWKNELEHQLAQKLGQQNWYLNYRVRVAKVERDYQFPTKEDD